jgi:hypothetical protein
MTPERGWTLECDSVDTFITEDGGHVGPVTFTLPTGHVHVMRGDVFCLPYGTNGDTPHGDTANARWSKECASPTTLHLSLHTRGPTGRVDKRIAVRDGHTALYTEHIITGMTGPMCLGHHTRLELPDERHAGRISTSRCTWGQVRPTPIECWTTGGHSALTPGGRFRSLLAVPTSTGGLVDVSRYPARPGAEDRLMVASLAAVRFAWTAVTVAGQQYVWFALRDPHVLRSTVMSFSNAGRPDASGSSRDANVLGLADVTAYFDYGLAESARPNVLARRRIPTTVCLSPDRPFVVRQITAVAPLPRGFDVVQTMRRTPRGLTLTAASGHRVAAPLDVGFLWRS